MRDYLFAFVWGWLIFFSLLGWGWLVLLGLRSKDKINFGWQAAFGLSLSVVLGGVLNLFSLISKASVIAYLSIGALLLLGALIAQRQILWPRLMNYRRLIGGSRSLQCLLLLLLAVIFVRYASSVAFFGFHGTDDYHGYMVYPAKMLQTGSLGNDPFSERRVISGLGGKYFLDTFVLAGAGFKNLHLIDNGVGILALLMLLGGLAKSRGLSAGQSLSVLLLAALVPSPSWNITSFFVAAVLFLALIRFLLEAGEQWPRQPQRLLALALLAAGLCALKSNLIFSCVILFLGYFFLQWQAERRRWQGILLACLATGLLVVLALLPWMIALKQSSGTFLYPFFGLGYQGAAYGTFLKPYLEFTPYSFLRVVSEIVVGLCLFVPFAGLGLLWLWALRGEERSVMRIAWLAALLGILAMIYGIGGYSLYYYTFPFVLPTVLASLILILARQEAPILSKSTLRAGFLGIALLTFLFGAYVQQDAELFQTSKDELNIDSGLRLGLVNSDLVPKAELDQYAALQAAVPAGQPILARLDRNFLFNFRRNPVYIIDLPGGASLPPGMPSFRGSEPLAQYFLSKGIKYVAYSYGNEANFSRAIDASMLRPHVNPELRTETEHAFDFQDNLMVLAASRKKIYDDGKNFILDLSQKP